jgi:hypothetical protein
MPANEHQALTVTGVVTAVTPASKVGVTAQTLGITGVCPPVTPVTPYFTKKIW